MIDPRFNTKSSEFKGKASFAENIFEDKENKTKIKNEKPVC